MQLPAKGKILEVVFPTEAEPGAKVSGHIIWGNEGNETGYFKLLLNDQNIGERGFAQYNYEIKDISFTMPDADLVLNFLVQRQTDTNVWATDDSATLTIKKKTAAPSPPTTPTPSISDLLIKNLPVVLLAVTAAGGLGYLATRRKKS